jgi:glycerol-3-phosphate cytidylyltransferase
MTTGVIAGNFDIIHPGYIDMFKECSEKCDKFIVLLHTDPSIERPEEKLKPILSVQERMKILFSLRYVTNIYTYTYERELIELLKEIQPDIRFLGDDYIGKMYTGFELNIPIHYINRGHGWSTRKFKQLIHDEYRKKMKLDD